MGRSDYLVQAGVGFDIDRSSAKKSIGIFEGLAEKLNTVATRKSVEAFKETEKEYKDSMATIEATNKKADEALIKSAKASTTATQQALQGAMLKPPKDAADKDVKAAGGSEAYAKKYKAQLNGMKSSYAKYVKEAAALGIKVTKAEKGFGTGKSVSSFEKDSKGNRRSLEDRKRLVKLSERMLNDERNKLKLMDKSTEAYKEQEAEVEALRKQHQAQQNLNEELYQQELKVDKVKRKGAKEERKAANKKRKEQKGIILGLKTIGHATKKVAQQAAAAAGKIKATLTNAFVIGTAAAGAFFYKMTPVNEAVQEFEKTIINANSVFQVTREELHSVSDTMVKFSLKYGVATQDMATGLYQLASAGLTAAESQEVLEHTMKLAMATQGDHNTLAKLTVQTIMGFGMEMEMAGELTDKFAHTIQKSLVEWQDLASSVKFAMPFFVATGQSIDQLLGGIEVLSNRALEAGIAGRGLRQALAQFTKHANDNESALAKLGVTIMDTEGNMRELSEIAMDAKAAFGDVTDLEALTAMLEDMNVRGATAFALLVQNADEYKAAVGDLANSAGEATQMADTQQQSLALQMQRVKNALLAPFLLSDKVGEANNTLNAFTHQIKLLTDEFVGFFIEELPDGTMKLNENGDMIKDFVIEALKELVVIIVKLKKIFLESNSGLKNMTKILHMAMVPMNVLLDVLSAMPDSTLKWIVQLKLVSGLLPITTILTIAQTISQTALNVTLMNGSKDAMAYAASMRAVGVASLQMLGGLILLLGAGMIFKNQTNGMINVLGALTGAFIAAGIARKFFSEAGWNPAAGVTAIIAGAAVGAAVMRIGKSIGLQMSASNLGNTSDYESYDIPTADTGYTNIPTADTGFSSRGRHFPVMVEPGETIVSKTQSMLGGGGITLNIGGDIVTSDADDFAERIAVALPEALRRHSDIGGI
jgi:TP901 family phage tail tape measure protein